MAMSAICKIKHDTHSQDANKAWGEAEFLLESRQHTEYFILCIARARPCFNCFKELAHEHLVKAYPLQSITHPSTSSSQVRQF